MTDKDIIIFVSGKSSKAKAESSDKIYEVVIGKAGAIDEVQKVDGDQKTPIGGPYKIMKVYYRKDRLNKPLTSVPLAALEEDDIWVDNPEDVRYNQPAKRSDSSEYSSHETLYREDHLYDLLVDIGFNRENIKPGKGSAIFLHLSRDQEYPNSTPTAGCIGFKKNDLLELIQDLDKNTQIYIKNFKYLPTDELIRLDDTGGVV